MKAFKFILFFFILAILWSCGKMKEIQQEEKAQQKKNESVYKILNTGTVAGIWTTVFLLPDGTKCVSQQDKWDGTATSISCDWKKQEECK